MIRAQFNFTDAQINAALSYIEENRDRVEAEYQQVLQTQADIRAYWEERNRDRFARIAAMPHKPETDAL